MHSTIVFFIIIYAHAFVFVSSQRKKKGLIKYLTRIIFLRELRREEQDNEPKKETFVIAEMINNDSCGCEKTLRN